MHFFSVCQPYKNLPPKDERERERQKDRQTEILITVTLASKSSTVSLDHSRCLYPRAPHRRPSLLPPLLQVSHGPVSPPLLLLHFSFAIFSLPFLHSSSLQVSLTPSLLFPLFHPLIPLPTFPPHFPSVVFSPPYLPSPPLPSPSVPLPRLSPLPPLPSSPPLPPRPSKRRGRGIFPSHEKVQEDKTTPQGDKATSGAEFGKARSRRRGSVTLR